jgi:hypothetical protein
MHLGVDVSAMQGKVAWNSSKQDYVNVGADSAVKREVREYAEVASVVGLRFCAEKERPLHEK